MNEHIADNDAPRRRTKTEARRCSQEGCPGDGRYQPPGKGHLSDCQHDAVAWVWGTVTESDAGCSACGRPVDRSLPDPIPEGFECMLTEGIVGRALYCRACYDAVPSVTSPGGRTLAEIAADSERMADEADARHRDTPLGEGHT